jgi:hypothetical protein
MIGIGIGVSRIRFVTAGGISAPPLLLDTYSGAAAAYSLRGLSTPYINSANPYACQVRNSSNVPLNIGFVFNSLTGDYELDTAALLAHCGGGNGFVDVWYDQSSNVRNATQALALSQPQIVSSGSVITENGKPAIKFLANKLETATFTLSAQPITRMFVGKTNTATADFIDGSATNRGFTGCSGGLNRLFAGNIFDSGSVLYTQQLFYGLFNGGSSEIIVNGTLQGTGDSGTAGLDKVILGSHPTVTTVDLNGTMQEAIIYPSNQNTNRTGIQDNINDFYSIY